MHTNLTESRRHALRVTLELLAFRERMPDERRERLLRAGTAALAEGSSVGWAYSAAIKADRATARGETQP